MSLSVYKETNNHRQLDGITTQTTFGNGSSVTNNPKLGFNEKNTFNGKKNPHWRAQIANRVDATTPAEGVKREFHKRTYTAFEDFDYSSTPQAHYVIQRSSYGSDFWGTATVSDWTTPPNLLIKADNKAKREFVNKLRKAQTAFQGGTYLGELRDAIAAVKRPAVSLRRGLDDYMSDLKQLAKGRLPATRQGRLNHLGKVAADTFLEYSLGWRPTVKESLQAINVLNRDSLFDGELHERVVGFGEEKYVYDITPNSTQCRPGWNYECRQIGVVQVKYIGGIGARCSAAGFAARSVGLHPSNWLPTAWELLPYSFVYDYFANIGDIINAATVQQSDMTFGNRLIRTHNWSEGANWQPARSIAEYFTYGSGQHCDVSFGGKPGRFKSVTKKFERSASIGSLIPTLEWSIPFKGGQIATLASLALASKEIRKRYRV